jgi:hypothetical protein
MFIKKIRKMIPFFNRVLQLKVTRRQSEVSLLKIKSKIFAGDDEKGDGDHNQVPGGGRH